jgi:hypothetical protein
VRPWEKSATETAPWGKASSLVLAIMAFYFLRDLFELPPQLNHVPAAILEGAAFLLLLRNGFFIPPELRPLSIGLLVLTTVGWIAGGIYSAFYIGYHLFGLLAYLLLFGSRTISHRVVPIFLAILVLPVFLITIGTDWFSSADVGNPQALFPSSETHWRINIGPPGSTIHFTAEVGLLLLLIHLASWLRQRTIPTSLLVATALYLIVFAGSRSAYIAALMTGVMMYINRNQVRPKTSYLILTFTVALLYASESLAILLPRFEGALGSLTKLTESNLDVTAGRAWLWAFHLHLFSSAPLTGVGLEPLRFNVGDLVADDSIARASSESVYTRLLAMYGIWGLIVPIIHLYLFRLTLLSRSVFHIGLGTMFILTTVGTSTYATIYGVFHPFVLASLAAVIPRYQRPDRTRARPLETQ